MCVCVCVCDVFDLTICKCSYQIIVLMCIGCNVCKLSFIAGSHEKRLRRWTDQHFTNDHRNKLSL